MTKHGSGSTRRGFLGAAASFMILPRRVIGGPGIVPPSEKTMVACIGLGGQGQIDLYNLLQFDEVQVAAVCDVHREGTGYISWDWGKGADGRPGGREPARRTVNAHYAEKTGTPGYRSCATYEDYRELLDREDIDAVVVATPDHTHAVITMAALKKRKHVYCEKPLTYSVEEARLIAVRTGKKLEWDGPNLRFTNDGEANNLLRRPYRKSWTL